MTNISAQMSRVNVYNSAAIEWNVEHFQGEPFAALTSIIPLEQYASFPSCAQLNELAQERGINVRFSNQETDSRYYEQIIFEDQIIPTRWHSWHDLFNAAIWMLFPKSKATLNKLHIAEITEHGLTPRTPMRDRITHFDECGVVLAVNNSVMEELLSEHQWQQAFVENRDCWYKDAKPFIFGHANYEMLLEPYIGLTGKWLAIEVSESFFKKTEEQQYLALDEMLAERFAEKSCFQEKGQLLPLPLLGIPSWCKENEDASFYTNTDYFRPKRRNG